MADGSTVRTGTPTPRWAEICYHTIFTPPLNADSVVLDLGASTAAFSRAVHGMAGSRCHAVEALPENFARMRPERWLTVHNFAIGGVEGQVRIHSVDEEFASAAMALMPGQTARSVEEVPGMTLDGLFALLGLDRAHLVKVDIEGAEFAMFGAASDDVLRRCDQITVEFHDFMDPSLTPAVADVIARLRGLGFFAIRFTRKYHGDVLFINPARTGLGTAEYLYARHVLRTARGLRRILGRSFA